MSSNNNKNNSSASAAAHQANSDPLFDFSEDIDELILGFLPDDERAQLEKEATAFVGDSLLLHDDLEARALQLLQEVNRDRDESILALRNTAGEQLTAVRRGMERFGKAEKAMRDLATSFAEMDGLISTMQSVSSYHQIRQLHYYHENLSNVIKWTECIEAFKPGEGAKEMEMILRGSTKLGEDAVFHVPTEEERAQLQTAKNFSQVYNNIRVMQSIRARLAIDSVAHDNRISIQVIRRHLDEGERILEVFLTTCLDIIRRAPEICVEYVLAMTDDTNAGREKAIRERDLLFEVIRIANQEAREPALYENIDVAAYHLQLSLQRMAGKGGEVARPDTKVVSLLSWQMLSRHLDSGVRSFFFEYCCVDSSDDERKAKGVEAQIADVKETCKTLDQLLEPYCECIERALTDPLCPIGSINLLPHIIKQIHAELCHLIEVEYCDPNANVDVTELLKCLELTISYRENSLEKGTIGQFVPPSAMEMVSTKVLEVAVSGMRDYLATNARNCALRVLDEEVQQMPQAGYFYTKGPGDMLFIVNSMLSAVTKNASNDVRSKMSMSCAVALRYYVDQFCEKIEFGENFEKWYAKLCPAEGVNINDRWALWVCAAMNDFTELQRNVGTLDASLFDLQHQAETTSIAILDDDHHDQQENGKSNKNKKKQSSSSVTSSLTPLQTFACILGKQVFTKLIGRIADYLELKVLPEKFTKAMDPSRYLPTAPPTASSAMQDVIDEIRGYSVASVQGAILVPWNAVASRTIVVRMIQVYVTKLLALIYDGLESKTTRGSLCARMGDDLRVWTELCRELKPIQEDQLRFEDRTDPDVMPDLGGTVGVLRVLLRLANVDSVAAFQAAVKEDVSLFCDVPEWLFDVMFENNKAASDVMTSSNKSQMKKIWKDRIDEQNRLYGVGGILPNRSVTAQDDDDDNDNNDDNNEQQQEEREQQNSLKARRSIFGLLDKNLIIPRKHGFFSSKTRDEGFKIVGERLGKVKICHDVIHIREAEAPLPKFGKKDDDVETISLAALLSGSKNQLTEKEKDLVKED